MCVYMYTCVCNIYPSIFTYMYMFGGMYVCKNKIMCIGVSCLIWKYPYSKVDVLKDSNEYFTKELLRYKLGILYRFCWVWRLTAPEGVTSWELPWAVWASLAMKRVTQTQEIARLPLSRSIVAQFVRTQLRTETICSITCDHIPERSPFPARFVPIELPKKRTWRPTCEHTREKNRMLAVYVISVQLKRATWKNTWQSITVSYECLKVWVRSLCTRFI